MNKRKCVSWIFPLFVMMAGACGGSSGIAPDVARTDGAADDGSPSDEGVAARMPIVIAAGPTMLGADCTIGVARAMPGAADLVWWPSGLNEQPYREVRGNFAPGSLIPACGRLHRLVSIASGRVTVDGQGSPPPAGVTLSADTLAVPTGGSTILAPAPKPLVTLLVNVKSIVGTGSTATATLDLTEVEYKIAGDPASRSTPRSAQVKAGDALTAGTFSFEVVAVIPPAPSAGIVGWAELDPTPTQK
jgi:hypothetical protein